MNEGPVPEGVWWVARDKVETYSSIGYLERMIGSQWHGGEARWGRYRVLLEADNKTDHKGREKLYICGGKLENSGGDIHLKDMCSVFVKNLASRVMQGGRVMLNVDYAVKKTRILGRLSSQYETGGRGSITVSTGVGDAGGVSYGAYQMTSKPNGGNVTLFVQAEDFPWKAVFIGLAAGSAEFSNKWKDVVATYKDRFVHIEYEFIKRTHYDPLVEKIKRENNIDITKHSDTLNDVIWSTAVQHGKNSGVVGLAISKVTIPVSKNKNYDRELIKAIYAERGRMKEDGNLYYFSKNSKQVQDGVSLRFEHELPKALKELENENY